jgi:hypothetical protein
MPWLATNGKGWAGSIACGVITGRTCSLTKVAQPAAALRVDPPLAKHRDSFVCQAGAQVLPDGLLRILQRQHRIVMAASCWVGVSRQSRSSRSCGGPGRSEAGDADHQEFVEIAARDRQETQPLQQRVIWIAGFGQDATVERQPAQLAVEIPLRAICHIGLRQLLPNLHYRPASSEPVKRNATPALQHHDTRVTNSHHAAASETERHGPRIARVRPGA